MKLVDEPKVFLIAEPQIDQKEMLRYLEEIGGEAWLRRVMSYDGAKINAPSNAQAAEIANTIKVPAAEGLIEFMGRLCYRSWEPGLNKNVTKIREDRGEYLLNVLRSGHGSVLEHANFSFVIHNCSRVLTAELNRHRAGIAISEQSLRYVRLDDLSFRLPPNLSDASKALMEKTVIEIEKAIALMIDREITDDMGFAEKKEKTSAIRRIAPLGLATEEGWTANVRAIRNVIEKRSAKGAEEEIRIFADQLAQIMQSKCPLLFGDYEPALDLETPSWSTPYEKV